MIRLGDNAQVDVPEELPLADRLALGQLAYLRQRSLRNPRYRNASYVRLYVTPRYLQWSRPSPFDPHLDAIRGSLSAFERLAQRGGAGTDDAWREVLAGVDLLLSEGQRRVGHRIRPKRL